MIQIIIFKFIQDEFGIFFDVFEVDFEGYVEFVKEVCGNNNCVDVEIFIEVVQCVQVLLIRVQDLFDDEQYGDFVKLGILVFLWWCGDVLGRCYVSFGYFFCYFWFV